MEMDIDNPETYSNSNTDVQEEPTSAPVFNNPVAETVCDLTTSSFRKIVDTAAFVDKSLFIKQFLLAADPMTWLKAPALFGKSTNLDMLRSFLSVQVDCDGQRVNPQQTENYKLFERHSLAIFARERSFFDKHCGRYPVVYLDFGKLVEDCKCPLDLLKAALLEAYNQHAYLVKKVGERWVWTSDKLTEDRCNPTVFGNHLSEDDTSNLLEQDYVEKSWKFLCKVLRKRFTKSVVFLMDDFDAPVTTAINSEASIWSGYLHWSNHLIAKMIYKLSLNLYTCVLITSTVAFAETGCCDHAQCLHQYINPDYDEWFGFTDDEVKGLLENPIFSHVKKSNLLRYYGGHWKRTGMFYYPWSVLSCLQKSVACGEEKIELYWPESRFPFTFGYLINNRTVRKEIWKIIHEKSHPCPPGKWLVQANDLCRLKKEPYDTVYSLYSLLRLLTDYGYLVQIQGINSGYLETPNMEMESMLMRLVGPGVF